MTSTTRRAAEISQKIAKFLNYDPNERSTNIGNATLENQIAGYNQPNIQSAIDELYFITTVPIGGLYASKYSNNPNPITWERQGQIENITTYGIADDTFVFTYGGVDVILSEGDSSTTAATKIAAALDASPLYSASASVSTVTITFSDPGYQDILTGSGAYGSPVGSGEIYGLSYSTTEVSTGSPAVAEVQDLVLSGTVAISNTIDIIDDSTSPETILATITIVPSDDTESVTTKLYNALTGISPSPFASVSYLGGSPGIPTVQVTWGEIDSTVSPEVITGDLRSRSLQDGSAGGIFIKGDFVQKAVSASDILSLQTSQIDTITISGTAIGATDLLFTALGINVTVGVGDTADVIAAAASSDINLIDGLTTTGPSGSPGTSFTIEYTNDGISRTTDYKEGFNTSGSTGIVGLTDPDPAGSDIIITYNSVQAQNSFGELGYGKWQFYGEGKVPACPISSMKAVGVQTINNTVFSEPYKLLGGSPATSQTVTLDKSIFDVAKFLFSVRSERGVYVTEITVAHDGINISYTNNVIVNTDSNESADDDPIDVSYTISGDSILMTFINNYGISMDVAIKINEHDIISSTPQENIIYYWERIE